MNTMEERQHGDVLEHHHEGYDYWHPATRIHSIDMLDGKLPIKHILAKRKEIIRKRRKNKMTDKLCIVFGCSHQRISDPALCEIHVEEAKKFRNRCDFMDKKQVKMITLIKCNGCGYIFGSGTHIIRSPECMNVAYGTCWDGRYNYPGATVCPNCGCGRNKNEIPLCSCNKK